ncbi:MAG: hypothetical protein R2838_01655 [Caldilineaceae bacterium]
MTDVTVAQGAQQPALILLLTERSPRHQQAPLTPPSRARPSSCCATLTAMPSWLGCPTWIFSSASGPG